MTTGTAIKALVMNIVANRKALCKLPEFYEQVDTEKLFGEGIYPCNLTGDVMARALGDSCDMEPKKIMTETAMESINEYDIPVSGIHADTTPKNVYGAYENSNEEDDAIHITRGHSKDHRPNLKQIIFGLGTTKDRVIVVGDVADRNINDKNWNKDILKELRHSISLFLTMRNITLIVTSMDHIPVYMGIFLIISSIYTRNTNLNPLMLSK